jgi:hypothetical protein
LARSALSKAAAADNYRGQLTAGIAKLAQKKNCLVGQAFFLRCIVVSDRSATRLAFTSVDLTLLKKQVDFLSHVKAQLAFDCVLCPAVLSGILRARRQRTIADCHILGRPFSTPRWHGRNALGRNGLRSDDRMRSQFDVQSAS